MPFTDPLIFVLIVLGVILACLIIIFGMRGLKKGERFSEEEKTEVQFKELPFKTATSVSRSEATDAREQLRTLDVEREILSSAIRRLYEAHAEGKITEEERERIAQTYKSRMMNVRDAISKDESIVALHELEAMQEDLIKLFSERFDDLSVKIDDLRSKVKVEPIREIAIPTARKTEIKLAEKTGRQGKRSKKKSAVKPSQRTEAEKRIEKIRAEVEKVLDKLGQMEIET